MHRCNEVRLSGKIKSKRDPFETPKGIGIKIELTLTGNPNYPDWKEETIDVTFFDHLTAKIMNLPIGTPIFIFARLAEKSGESKYDSSKKYRYNEVKAYDLVVDND